MPSISVLAPSGDTTGAADTAAVNSALSSVGSGGSVQLDPVTGTPMHACRFPPAGNWLG
jgi:hypothetical protein